MINRDLALTAQVWRHQRCWDVRAASQRATAHGRAKHGAMPLPSLRARGGRCVEKRPFHAEQDYCFSSKAAAFGDRPEPRLLSRTLR
jgi:hypothetical protein